MIMYSYRVKQYARMYSVCVLFKPKGESVFSWCTITRKSLHYLEYTWKWSYNVYILQGFGLYTI